MSLHLRYLLPGLKATYSGFKTQLEETVSGHCIISPACAYGCLVFRHMLWGSSWPRAVRGSRHMGSNGGITIRCCDVIKSLSGEGLSEGFTAGGFIAHTETPKPQQ